jgi:hypothetical protein
MLDKDYDRRCSIEKKKILAMSLKRLSAKMNCGGKPPVVK